MQFLESSVIGLRSARHVFAHEDGRRVTLFPMVHVGDAGFYEAVSQDATRHDVVLTEGINTPVVRRLTASYRWLDLKRLRLILQPRDAFDALGDRAIRADLSPAEFVALWQTAPLWTRVVAQGLAPAVGAWQRIVASRSSIARALSQDDLPARDEVMMWDRRTAPLLQVILKDRDARLRRHLRHVLMSDQVAQVAVVYGAAHMPCLLEVLQDAGFGHRESAWMTVIAL